jgi:hypothetical protein
MYPSMPNSTHKPHWIAKGSVGLPVDLEAEADTNKKAVSLFAIE